ncbi:MAG TPA: hypothetical protein VFH56_01435 [Acidimicrobiales bacterium]|nr:hypothetical protein [Acidimicrobiales bacterium]
MRYLSLAEALVIAEAAVEQMLGVAAGEIDEDAMAAWLSTRLTHSA